MSTEQAIARVPLFAKLEERVLAAVASRCRVRSFEPGQHLLHHEDRSDDIFFMVSGRARVVLHSPSGRDVSFRDLVEGEVFGELAALDGGRRSASVVAVAPTQVAIMSRAAFLGLVRAHPPVAESLLRHLVGLIRRYSQRVYELSTLGVEERIRSELLRLAWEHGGDARSAVIRPAPTLAELASLVGTTREAVSREVASLARGGIVERRGRDLAIHDLGRLAALIEDQHA
jgi:CRP/FNR family transcriptional regulator, cyclic AMP receptor protein